MNCSETEAPLTKTISMARIWMINNKERPSPRMNGEVKAYCFWSSFIRRFISSANPCPCIAIVHACKMRVTLFSRLPTKSTHLSLSRLPVPLFPCGVDDLDAMLDTARLLRIQWGLPPSPGSISDAAPMKSPMLNPQCWWMADDPLPGPPMADEEQPMLNRIQPRPQLQCPACCPRDKGKMRWTVLYCGGIKAAANPRLYMNARTFRLLSSLYMFACNRWGGCCIIYTKNKT